MPMQARRLAANIAQTHPQLVSRRMRKVSTTFRLLSLRERLGVHCRECWVCLGADLEGTDNLAPAGIRNPGSSAHSESLYLLRY